MSAKTAKRQQGDAFEERAAALLMAADLQIIARNYLVPKIGEIDIIALERREHRGRAIAELVFIEVRSRRRSDFGTAIDSITPAKQAKIRQSAEYFLAAHPEYGELGCRFDVVVFDLNDHTVTPEWLVSAF